MGYPHFTGEDARWEFKGEVSARICRRLFGEPPKIVTLCGSTRFREEFEQVMKEETLKGHLVISVGLFGHEELPEEETEKGHPTKDMLDELHKRKIDLADEVLVINPGGYIGESTAEEIIYAQAHGKDIRYLVESSPDELHMLRVNNKPMRCECGCNIFRRLFLNQLETKTLKPKAGCEYYQCNACNTIYEGDPA